MRFVFVVALTILITVSVGTVAKEYRNQGQRKLISPEIAGINTEGSTDIEFNNTRQYSGWQTFVNNFSGYKIRHPVDTAIKNSRNGDVAIVKEKEVYILLSQKNLSQNDNINTVIEADIDKKSAELKDKFILLDNISPIAIGSVTAQTYSSKENGISYLYFYLPQNDEKYLFVSAKIENQIDKNSILAEDIVYSIELHQ